MDLFKVFTSGRNIKMNDLNEISDCYLHYAYIWGLNNYRVITIGDLLEKKIIKGSDIPDHVYDFIGQRGKVLMICNYVNSPHGAVVTDIAFKALGEKYFVDVSNKKSFPYGFFSFDKNFKYGDTVIIVEGFKDCDSLKLIYPNVIACKTAGLSAMGAELVSTVTNKFLLAYDNDDAGNNAYIRDCHRLRDLSCEVEKLYHYDQYKDCGALADTYFNGDMYENKMIRDYYDSSFKVKLGETYRALDECDDIPF